MKSPVVIPTGNPNVVIRELWTDQDDKEYYEAYEESRAEIGIFDPDVDTKHTSEAHTRKTRLEAVKNLRTGIWEDGIFSGSVNARENDGEDGVEIGYWIRTSKTGRGLATLAARAMSEYAAERYDRVYAKVKLGNAASARVLENVGYSQTGESDGELIYELRRG